MVGSDAEFGKKSIWSTNSKFVMKFMPGLVHGHNTTNFGSIMFASHQTKQT
jgi:hypothetical protein